MDVDERARSLAAASGTRCSKLEPLLGTSVGDERFDDRLSDPGEAGAGGDGPPCTGPRSRSAGDRPRTRSSRRGAATLDMLEASRRRELAGIERRIGPPGRSTSGDRRRLVGEVASLQRRGHARALERYVTRLRAIPGVLRRPRADLARRGRGAGRPRPPWWSTAPRPGRAAARRADPDGVPRRSRRVGVRTRGRGRGSPRSGRGRPNPAHQR